MYIKKHQWDLLSVLLANNSSIFGDKFDVNNNIKSKIWGAVKELWYLFFFYIGWKA